MRFHTSYLLLLAIYQVKWTKEHGGKLRVLCGSSEEDGSATGDMFNLSNELAELEKGVEIELPDDTRGGTCKVTLIVHLLLLTADTLAAGALGPTPESTSGLRPCRDCLWLPRCQCSKLSAEQQQALDTLEHDELCCGTAPRTHEQLALDLGIARCWTQSKTALKKFMSEAGLGKRYFITEYLCGMDNLDDLPVDIMHLFLCGISRYELCWLFDFLIPQYTTWDKVNEECKRFRAKNKRKMPYLFRPKGDGSRGSVSMTLTALETMDFALARCAARRRTLAITTMVTTAVLLTLFVFCVCSLDILRAVLPKQAMESAHWKSWVAHVKLLTFCLQHTFERSDLTRVDELVAEYMAAFPPCRTTCSGRSQNITSSSTSANTSSVLGLFAAFGACRGRLFCRF